MGCGASKRVIKTSRFKQPPPFKKSSKIAVIGSGAGGLLMAAELIKKGYTNITIFEKENRVGGKALTVTVNNQQFDTGTVLTYADKNVLNLLEEVDLLKETCAFDNSCSLIYSKKEESLISKLAKAKEITGIDNIVKLKYTLDSQLKEFKILYDRITDRYGFPRREFVKELIKPIGVFLRDHGLEKLRPLIDIRLKSRAYDRSDNEDGMLTYYALFFLDPQYLNSDADILQFNGEFGFQDIWKKLSKLYNMEIEFNSLVEIVKMNEEQGLELLIKNTISKDVELRIFDFCIFNVPKPFDIISQPTYKQKECFSKFNHFSPVLTTVYTVKEQNLKTQLVFDRESFYNTGIQTGLSLYRKTSSEDCPIVAYTAFNNDSFITNELAEEYGDKVEKQIKYLTGLKITKKIHSIVNNWYLPHCTAEDVLAGLPWQLFQLQGENKMWFVGAMTCFDLTQAIIAYNKKLLDQYDFEEADKPFTTTNDLNQSNREGTDMPHSTKKVLDHSNLEGTNKPNSKKKDSVQEEKNDLIGLL